METLPAWIDRLEQDRSLLRPERLRERSDALERLENTDAELDAPLRRRVEILRAGLESADRRLYESIRHEIRRGAGAEAMRAWAAGSEETTARDGHAYDHLDALLSGVLALEEPGPDIAELAADMVFYQPTPARHIFEFIRRAELGERDVLIDLGSGLGHVPLLAAICTGARCIGVEQEAAYVECARRCAHALGLSRASFVRQDAREADVSAGTVFYLYTPFIGAMLSEVLALLKRQAAVREIRIGTLGPCTPVLADEPWLESADPADIDRPALFRSLLH